MTTECERCSAVCAEEFADDDNYCGQCATIIDLEYRLDQATDTIESQSAEIARLRGWLLAIDGGDTPCTDESQLRNMAYRAVTLGHAAPE